ncbi:MAG: hypothetical protein HY926_09565 [Elusimicrobia bacterium]|nr:hypothetical protein [Elusimicrobiota bacterium]
MARSSSRRGGLLLLELAFDEPEHQNGVEAFPLLMGVGRRLGWPVAWLTLGVRYEPAMLYRLASGDLRVLLGETARTRPRAVIVSARLDERQRRRLESAGARVLICPIDEGAVDELPRFIKTALPEACRPWLDDPRLFDRLDPDYRRRPLNRAPWTRRAIIRVVAGMRCSYLSRAAENPFYR